MNTISFYSRLFLPLFFILDALKFEGSTILLYCTKHINLGRMYILSVPPIDKNFRFRMEFMIQEILSLCKESKEQDTICFSL